MRTLKKFDLRSLHRFFKGDEEPEVIDKIIVERHDEFVQPFLSVVDIEWDDEKIWLYERGTSVCSPVYFKDIVSISIYEAPAPKWTEHNYFGKK